MADKLMYIPNNDTRNYPFCGLQLMVETFRHSTNQNSLKSPKLLIQRIRKSYNKTLETSAINSPLSPLSLVKKTLCECGSEGTQLKGAR